MDFSSFGAKNNNKMSDIAKRLTKGRREAASKNKELQDEQRLNLLKNINKSLKEENSELKNEIECLRSRLQNAKMIPSHSTNEIIEDLCVHLTNTEEEYSDKTIALAIEINSTSAKAYKILAEVLPFPNISIINRKYEEGISEFPKHLTQKEYVNDLVNAYKETNNTHTHAGLSARCACSQPLIN